MNGINRYYPVAETNSQLQNEIPDFNVLILSPTATKTIPMSWHKASHSFNYLKRNEELLLTAIRNLIKKSNFVELSESLDAGEITVDEFNNRLDKELDKYAITIKEMENPDDILNVIELTERIGVNLKDFTVSDVSELFSIREHELLLSIASPSPKLV